MRRILSATIWFLAIGTAFAGNPKTEYKHGDDQTTVNLRLNFKQGDKYLFSSAVKQTTSQEIMGQKMESTQDMITDYIYDVESVQSDVTRIKVTFDALSTTVNTGFPGASPLTYDSRNPEQGSAELKTLSNLVGKSFYIDINKGGEVTNVEGLADVISSVGGEQSQLLSQLFDDGAMTNSLNAITHIYPDKSVKIGESWNKSTSGPIASVMHSEADFTYLLDRVEGDLATVSISGQQKISTSPDGGANPLLQGAEFNLNGTQTGSAEIEMKSGLIVTNRQQQEISGTVSAQGFEIPMRLTIDTTITGKKL